MTRLGLVAALVCASTVALAGPAKPKARAKAPATRWKPSFRYEAPADTDTLPAYRYSSMSSDACKAELTARGVPFVEEIGRGVSQPVRLTGPLHGVTYRTDEKDHANSAYEIADCRLVLALDDFAQILERHDIVEVRHYSIYRPPGKAWPEDKAAKQHAGGLALDAGRFITKAGTTLDVTKHFHGAIGDRTCGKDAAPHPVTAEATELRAILCEAVGDHLFNIVLTPNFNRPHHNHFHLEVAAGIKWYLVH